MIKALGPGLRRGCLWVWLSIVLIGSGSAAFAQAPPKKKADPGATKKESPPAAKDVAKDQPAAKADDKDNAPDENPDDDRPGVEVFKDPHAEAALAIFKSVSGIKDSLRPQDINAVKSMAGGGDRLDEALIERYVSSMAARLIDKANINGLINPPVGRMGSSITRAIQETSVNLIDPLNMARLAKNTAFLDIYSRQLINILPKLLDNNLVARTEAMIVLGQVASPRALPIFIKEIKEKNQTVQVKLWAARGIANVVDNGAALSSVPASEALTASKAISDFLGTDKDTLWFLQMRALEALGSLRQAAVATNLQKAEMAVTAMSFLAAPDGRPEVRASAAWALGMMQINPAIRGYNFPLVAYDTGTLAAEIGAQVNSGFRANQVRSNYLTGLLVAPIYQTFKGIDGARESGLLNAPALGSAQSYVARIADLTASVSKASIELIRAPNGQIDARQKDLGERLATLKAYLDKNPPKDWRLVPGGPEFKVRQAQVADAPGAQRRLAGAAGGR